MSVSSKIPSIIHNSTTINPKIGDIKNISNMKILHLFFYKSIIYDKAGMLDPSEGQLRYMLDIGSFDNDDNVYFPFIKNSIENNNLFPCVDISCCSWFERNKPSPKFYSFLDYILTNNGIIRFSDFSLDSGKEYLNRIGFPINFDVIPYFKGSVKITYNPKELISSGMEDLAFLGRLTEDPSVKKRSCLIEAMPYTRKMKFKKNYKYPEYMKVLIWIECEDKVTGDYELIPGLIVVTPNENKGKIIIWSLHFSSLSDIEGINIEKIAKEIKIKSGEEESLIFLNNISSIRQLSGESGVREAACEAVSKIMGSLSPSQI